jgi:hypothetical protein
MAGWGGAGPEVQRRGRESVESTSQETRSRSRWRRRGGGRERALHSGSRSRPASELARRLWSTRPPLRVGWETEVERERWRAGGQTRRLRWRAPLDEKRGVNHKWRGDAFDPSSASSRDREGSVGRVRASYRQSVLARAAQRAGRPVGADARAGSVISADADHTGLRPSRSSQCPRL